jgi:hypothetical protein
LRRPVSEPEHGSHASEPDEVRRHARKRDHDAASADPGKRRTAALPFASRFDQFRIGAFWLRRIRRRIICLAMPAGIG